MHFVYSYFICTLHVYVHHVCTYFLLIKEKAWFIFPHYKYKLHRIFWFIWSSRWYVWLYGIHFLTSKMSFLTSVWYRLVSFFYSLLWIALWNTLNIIHCLAYHSQDLSDLCAHLWLYLSFSQDISWFNYCSNVSSQCLMSCNVNTQTLSFCFCLSYYSPHDLAELNSIMFWVFHVT